MSETENSERVLATGWDDVDKAIASGSSWLRWTNGQVHQLNVCGTPQWVEKTFDDGPKRRVRVQVYVPGEGLKQWEMSPTVYKELKEERALCKAPVADAVFLVKRQGDGMQTTYKMRYERQLTPSEVTARRETKAPATSAGDIPF